MSTTALEPRTPKVDLADRPVPAPARTRAQAPGIPMTRLISVELRKMFNTRSGFWLMMSILIVSVIATGALIVFAPDDQLTFANFASAIGFPMAIILPIIAILSVTSEWSQRSGLTTFTLVPRRGRILGAKFIASVMVGVVAMFIALAVGALGTVIGALITGVDAVWDITVADFSLIVLGNVLGLLMGYMLGVVIRNSAGAIVAYFVWTLVLPTVFGILAATQQWFADLQPWVDYAFSQTTLFEGSVSSEQWQQLAVSGTLWFLLPLVVGLVTVRRAEVK